MLYAEFALIFHLQTQRSADRREGASASLMRSRPSAGIARCRPHWRRLGFREADLTRLAEDAMKQTRLLVNNPREVTYQDAYAIDSEALDGRKRQAA